MLDWETHLVTRAKRGERVAFELIADMHRSSMRQLAHRMLRDPEDAQDAVQDALVKAYRALHSFQPGRPVLPWLMRICSNCCVDMIRQKKASACDSLDKHEYGLEDPSTSIESGAETKLLGETIAAAIEKLPARYRSIIEMRHFRHMEVMEIAAALNKPEGTVKSWLFRARAMLKKELQLAHI